MLSHSNYILIFLYPRVALSTQFTPYIPVSLHLKLLCFSTPPLLTLFSLSLSLARKGDGWVGVKRGGSEGILGEIHR